MSFIKKLQNKIELGPKFFVTQKIELPIYSFNIKHLIDSDDIKNRCLLLKTDDLGNNKIVKNGWQSPYYFRNTKEFNLFNDLISVIEDKVNTVLNFQKKLFISEIWFVLYRPETTHNIHNHIHPVQKNKYIFSGVYYPVAEEFAAPIIFRDAMDDNSKETEIPIKQDELLIFSSALYHYVPKGTNENLRIAISFNLELSQ
jgi:hypothetical protein